MTWQRLEDRLDILPLILAGPILRKVTESSVTIWLALKQQADVTLDIYSGDGPPFLVLFSGKRSTVRIGPNLHLAAVTARRGNHPPLAAGTVYSYDLSFATDDGPNDLQAAVGGSGKAAYAYGTRRLPSFALPPEDLEDVRLIQGSCRKPNADGHDALAMLDDLIAASVDSAVGRPHQLLLTGDQIYADEVADVLLLMLTDAASALIGDREPLPYADGTQSFAEEHPPTTRTEVILKEAKLTTVDNRSHLMSLGEYLAMYLFVWSDVLWPGPQLIPDFNDLAIKLQFRPPAFLALQKLSVKIATQRANVNQLRSTLIKVRRALANVPTAMIFDDHEITDDWNMIRAFCDNVYGNPLGRRIVQNGLAAYALCQHWGNAPEQFENNPNVMGANPAGVELLHLFDTSAKYADIADHPFLKTALGIHTADELAAHMPAYAVFHNEGARYQTGEGWIDSQSLLYHYSLESKAYQVIVTDSRSWREFPRPGKTSPPNLIAQSQLAIQIGKTPKLGDRLLLVVVTTNMPPGPTIRQLARDLPILVKVNAVNWFEDAYDAWEIRRIDFARALAEISRKFDPNEHNVHSGSLILLSGDVHSSSASRITYSAVRAQVGDAAGAATRAELSVAQLIGSALHNNSAETVGQHEQGYSFVPPHIKGGVDVANEEAQTIMLKEGFVGWNPVTMPQGFKIGILNIDQAGGDFEPNLVFRSDLCTTPLRDEELPHVYLKKIVKITESPDYRIRLDYFKVTNSGRYNYEPKVLEPSDNPLKRSADKARAYEDYLSSVSRGSEMVGLNNIGEITFIRNDLLVGPKLLTRYRVRWHEKGKIQFVEYDLSLDVLDPSFAQIPYPT